MVCSSLGLLEECWWVFERVDLRMAGMVCWKGYPVTTWMVCWMA